jgi:hypothetical protein
MKMRVSVPKQYGFSRVFENTGSREALGSMHCSMLRNVSASLASGERSIVGPYVW